MKYEERFMSAEARRVYYGRLAALSISRKVEMVSELGESVKDVARSVIRATMPWLGPLEVEGELRRRSADR